MILCILMFLFTLIINYNSIERDAILNERVELISTHYIHLGSKNASQI